MLARGWLLLWARLLLMLVTGRTAGVLPVSGSSSARQQQQRVAAAAAAAVVLMAGWPCSCRLHGRCAPPLPCCFQAEQALSAWHVSSGSSSSSAGAAAVPAGSAGLLLLCVGHPWGLQQCRLRS